MVYRFLFQYFYQFAKPEKKPESLKTTVCSLEMMSYYSEVGCYSHCDKDPSKQKPIYIFKPFYEIHLCCVCLGFCFCDDYLCPCLGPYLHLGINSVSWPFGRTASRITVRCCLAGPVFMKNKFNIDLKYFNILSKFTEKMFFFYMLGWWFQIAQAAMLD